MIVEVRIVVVTDDNEGVLAQAGGNELVVQVADVEQNVLAASAKTRELADAARDAVVEQLRKVGEVEVPAGDPGGRARPFGRRP